MAVPIRDAKPDEADALSALALRSKAHWGYAEDFIAACVDELTLTRRDIEGEIVRVSDQDDRPAGYYYLVFADGIAEVEHLFVAPEAIGGGLGRALWTDLMARAEDLGAREIRVTSDPHAEGFYRAMGCRSIGAEPSTSIPGRSLPRLALALRAPANA